MRGLRAEESTVLCYTYGPVMFPSLLLRRVLLSNYGKVSEGSFPSKTKGTSGLLQILLGKRKGSAGNTLANEGSSYQP